MGLRCVLAVIVLVGFSPVGIAQPPAGAGSSAFQDNVSRGFVDARGRFVEPSFDIEAGELPAPSHRQVLPAPSPESDDGNSPTAASHGMRVTTIAVKGNTVIPDTDVAAVTAPFSHRHLSPENLQELRRRLSLLYYNAGYVNSGVLLPATLPEQGALTLEAVEGELNDIELVPAGRLSPARVKARVRSGLARPLNIYDLQDSLLRLELNPLVRKVNATLIPGLSPGTADLQLQVEEARAMRLMLSADNYRSPTVGSERGMVSLENLNLTGRADRLALAASASEGLKDGYIEYSLPLNTWNTQLKLGYQRGDSTVIEEPFDDLDIESETESWGVSLLHPVIDRLDRTVTVSTALSYSHSETVLLGKPFSFSLGARNGEITSTSIGVGAEWIERLDESVLALRSSLRFGLDWFDATTIPDGFPTRQPDTGARIPESDFTALLTQFQYARRMPWLRSQLVFSAVWQQAFDPLLSVEKFAVGGFYSVRGFRENQLVRDSGASASVEWRIPILADGSGVSRWNLTAVPFIDYGRSWDYDDNLSTHKPARISSVGMGLRWLPTDYTYVSVFYGERIADDDVPPPSEDSLQDDGFHFSVAFNWPLW